MDTCTITTKEGAITSTDFIAFVCTEDGDIKMEFNTDALTLGIGMRMISRAFVDTMSKLTEEEREEVTNILQGKEEVADGQN